MSNTSVRRSLAAVAASGVFTASGLLWATDAHADPGTDYGESNWPIICTVLDDYPSIGGITGIGKAIVDEGNLSFYQAGEAIGWAVYQHCPRHSGLIDQFIGATTKPQSGFVA